ncbi:UNVERIFIED_CONTAM: hypothetical protein Slati_4194800 [Sesamum latifolium]|uniref:Integrase zinc-binding domain-containing protein n=1 Tax=Sesamum latifolium TaxID=2727402 RepID=A0AAW2TA99_9LAMI
MKIKVQEGKNDQFVIKNDGTLMNGKRMCVPNVGELRTEIMHEAHYAQYAMHPGGTKMYRDLRPYYWPTMKKDVAEFVAKCLTCQQRSSIYFSFLGKLAQGSRDKIAFQYGISSSDRWIVRKNDSDVGRYDESLCY